MSSQVSNLFLPKLPCTRIQSVIEIMFVSCMCLFSLPLVPVPDDVPSGTSPSQRGMCSARSAWRHTQRIENKQTLLITPDPLTAESEMVTWPTSLTQGASVSAYQAPFPPPLIQHKIAPFFIRQTKERDLHRGFLTFYSWLLKLSTQETYGY